jgi:hypothetical protein
MTPEPAHPIQILGRVDAARGGFLAQVDGDRLAVPEHAELFERLDRLDRSGFELRESLEETQSIGVEPDVSQG